MKLQFNKNKKQKINNEYKTQNNNIKSNKSPKNSLSIEEVRIILFIISILIKIEYRFIN